MINLKTQAMAFLLMMAFSFGALADGHSVPDAMTPAAALENLETYFNAGDTEGLVSLFTDDAIFINAPSGDPHTTRASITEAMGGFVDLGVTLKATPRRVYQSGDIALIIVDWVLTGPDANGKPFNMTGTATDVVSRDEHGVWHYRIDNAFGTQRPE